MFTLCVHIYVSVCTCVGVLCVFVCACIHMYVWVCRYLYVCVVGVFSCVYFVYRCVHAFVLYVCAYVCCVVWYHVQALGVCVCARVHIHCALCIHVHVYVESAGMSARVEPNQKGLLAVNLRDTAGRGGGWGLGAPPPPPHSNLSAFCRGFSLKLPVAFARDTFLEPG